LLEPPTTLPFQKSQPDSAVGVADQARSATQWLLQHPEWPLGVAALLIVLRPGRALRWAGWAWQGYSLYQRGQRVLNRAARAR